MSSPDQENVILVTGANRGIGFHIVKRLLAPPLAKNTLILLGSRDIQRGHDAILKLGSPSNVRIVPLDMSSTASILQAVEEIKKRYHGRLSVIINNAAILEKEVTVENARHTFATNYYGIKLLNEQLVSMMQEDGRIINVSSQLGPMVLAEVSEELREKYTSLVLTVEELDRLVEEFISAIQSNTYEALGYTVSSGPILYGISKATLNALTQIEAREWSTKKNLLVVAASPGFCATDMTQHAPTARSPDLGADSILHAVHSSKHELNNGGFYRDGQQLPLVSQH